MALTPHNLGGLLHFPLVQTLETITSLPTLMVNDTQATWAEYHALPEDIRDMVFITVSIGRGGEGRSGGMRRQNPIYSRWRRPSAGAASGEPICTGSGVTGR